MDRLRPAVRLNPEKVAYWYFRLNGFLQIENFVVHPERRGGQRTDADLLAVRFPFRAERLYDDPEDIMNDDSRLLAPPRDQTDLLAPPLDLIDIVIAEVKTNQPCTLNGPWTDENRSNMQRVLVAIGCLPHDQIDNAAKDLYRRGLHQYDRGRIRIVAVGRTRNESLAESHPDVLQLVWRDLLEFIWSRFDRYRRQKAQVDQWDAEGREIRRLADEHCHSCEEFVAAALGAMGVRNDDPNRNF